VAVAWTLCLGVLVAAPKRPLATPDPLLVALPSTFYALHLAVAAGAVPPAHLAFLLVAMGFGLSVNVAAHGPSFLRQRHTAAN
jgi:hypothetical protein